MTTALYVLGCLLVGGGTVVLLLAMPDSEEPLEKIESATPMPPAGTPVGPSGHCSGTEADPVDDFTMWEQELGDARPQGREHDQRARRALARWERETRRRQRGR